MDSRLGSLGIRGLKTTLIAGLTLLTTDALLAQGADQNDVGALKAQMNEMQKQYEKRIEAMEAKMKALESNEASGSILNTHILTDSEGKAMEGKGPGPMLDESFLKSLTRNFAFTAYLRAGFGVNGSGGAQVFSFVPSDNFLDGGRSRLGNENDIYMELSYVQNHILGDSPDLMDVSARFTIQYFSTFRQNSLNTQVKSTTTTIGGTTVVNGVTTQSGNVGVVEAFVLAKNIFKGVPEIGVWAGDRFYDRWNIDSMDWFWLNMSGIGYGFQDIPLGPGKLWVAWFGGNDNNSLFNYPTVGQLFKQSLDVRWKDVDIGFGKLTPFVIGSYIKGGTVVSSGSQTFTDILGNKATYHLRTDDTWGVGGGVIWEYKFGHESRLRLAAMAGRGAVDFHSDPGTQETEIIAGFQHALDRQALKGNPIPATLNFHNAANDALQVKALGEFIWNPADNFSLGVWAAFEHNDQGTGQFGKDEKGRIKEINGERNIVVVGTRPVFWLTDTFAIQGQFVGYYGDDNRGNSGTKAFGRSGEMGVFTIAPTFKPKGGFFTRPELRLFATFSAWSDSWKGSTTQGAAPYANPNANYGWMFGSQAEIWW